MRDTSPFLSATDEKSLHKGASMGRSSILMRAGYFYGNAHSETQVPTPQGVALAIGDNGIQGPFRMASEASMNAESRVSNTVLDGAADKAFLTAVKLHGPNSEQARRYQPAMVGEEDMAASAAAVEATLTERPTVVGLATDRGVDPLSSFRALAANGSIPKDDIRQLAAAYTHPDEDQRLPMPTSARRSVDEVRLDRDDAVTLAAIRKLERGGLKNRAAEAYEDLGMSIADKGNPAGALPFLMNSCSLAREHTREHGRDVRPLRPTRKLAEADAR